MTCQELGPLFGVSENTIRRRLKRNNITIRQGPEYRTKDSELTIQRRVATRGEDTIGVGPNEKDFAGFLDNLGVRYVQQRAIGHYNVDFALQELPIIIEIQSGGGSRSARANHFKRTKFLLDSGYHVVYVRFNWTPNSGPLTLDSTKHIIACCHALSRDPASPRKYRVFRADGRAITFRGENRNRWAAIGAL
ncbi:DUF559 domain-containing protein [Corynebacterium macclintockiae]|uniref:DUF559 domain-containing protein n=1 Tax=Corynebacterium TaxID=1716 RepID=UPI003EBFDEA0